MASNQRNPGVHARDHGCVKGRRFPEDNAKASARVVSGIEVEINTSRVDLSLCMQ